ncbi:MAG: M20/M25/M40 family metallo-hydrolase [Bacteroidia bacterium]|nr:M20/M25/M40 family metallo-hydrolase [Bacteroidia bacterium]
MKIFIIILVIGTCGSVHAQKANKLIKEKNVARIIKTLSADDMMGRSARKPEQIEKATLFIENEFKKIGLQPLSGQTSFRQEFIKEQISPIKLDVTLDGEKVAIENLILVSEKSVINMVGGLSIKTIEVDPQTTNQDQYFFDKAFALVRDTTSCIVVVGPEFQANFMEFKGYFKERFLNNRKSTKIFVLGKSKALTYSVKATQKIESIKMANVVGMLEGKSSPDDLVVFSGHYDHIGIQAPIEGDSIANGADDDASGTTAVITLAKYFKKLKNNNRTLIFTAFTAEEIGGYGSQYFSKQLDPDKVIAMFNIEMIGKPSKWGQNNAFITGFERSDFGKILQKNLAGTLFQFHPDPYPEQNLFYRSDNATLARLGVPAHSISTDEIDIDKFYHTVNDEMESLDMANITAAIRAIALSSKTIVSGADTPTRIDKATVR